jgi:RimJ/RimL family protein N-acetyltransferase
VIEQREAGTLVVTDRVLRAMDADELVRWGNDPQVFGVWYDPLRMQTTVKFGVPVITTLEER